MSAPIPSFIEDNYEILQPLHTGTMSTVWLAKHRRLGSLWAIKQIRREDSLRHDLKKEYEFLRTLRHPSLPFAAGIYEDKDSLYIVEEYAAGITLEQYLGPGPGSSGEPDRENTQEQETVILSRIVPEGQARAWFHTLCSVLSFLHSQSPPVIHRDLKPSNIIVQANDSLKLIDFGIAIQPQDPSAPVTDGFGTPGYSAPEQFRSVPIDPRADIYALGATMFHVLTGTCPADAPEMLPCARRLRPQISEGMEYILRKCTETDPSDRYPSVEAVLTDLQRIDSLKNTPAGRRKENAEEQSSNENSRPAGTSRHSAPLRPVLLLLLLAGIAGSLTFILLHRNKQPSETAVVPSETESAQTEELSSYEKALQLLNEGHTDDAIVQFTVVLKESPDESDALIGRGDAYLLSAKEMNSFDAIEERVRLYDLAEEDYSTAQEAGSQTAGARLSLVSSLRQEADIDIDMREAFQNLEAALLEEDEDRIFRQITAMDTVKNSYCNVHHLEYAVYPSGDRTILAGWPWTYYGAAQTLPSGKGTVFNQDRTMQIRLDADWENGMAQGTAVETVTNLSPEDAAGNFFLTRERTGQMRDGRFDGDITETLTYKLTGQDDSGHITNRITPAFTISYQLSEGSPLPVSRKSLPKNVSWVNGQRLEEDEEIYAFSAETGLLFYLSDYTGYTYRIGTK